MIFNPAAPSVMHIDLNSCFASVEQQANHLLRDKPVVVAAYAKPYGCILAPSVEAKLYGIKTGMSVKEGLGLCPFLIVREADPPKYREVHARFDRLLNDYSSHVVSKSIDEFVLTLPPNLDLPALSQEIKARIKQEIGDYLRVSIGVSTNQVLAKLASGIHKPNGFDIIDASNYYEIYGRLKLQDLCGINVRNEARLHRVGIFTLPQFYDSDIQTLSSAFQSVLGRYWYTRLHGYEVDDVVFTRRTYGQSYVLPTGMEYESWRPILSKLVAKAARRLRAAGYQASGVHLALNYADHTHWHTGHQGSEAVFDDASLLNLTLALYHQSAPKKPVKKIAFTCFGLAGDDGQLSLMVDKVKQKSLVKALDSLNDKWGEYSVNYGSFLGSHGHVRDAIAFGK
jgi:DNA polymerase-4